MKPFFDVFPTLQVKGDLRDYFAETQVERLTTNKERTRIKVVLRSDHLIHKKRVFKMQEEISRQVFGDRAPEVYIDEHYTLSSQYTPRRLMEEYFDSLVSEIGSFSHVMGLYFREARVEYRDDENVLIMLQDSCLSRKLSMKLEEALNRIFRERCGVSAALTVGLEQRKKEKEGIVRRKTAPLQGAEAAFAVRGFEGGYEGTESADSSLSGNGGIPEYGSPAADNTAQAAGTAPAPGLSFKKKESAPQSAGGQRGGK